jgi:hypothetical protein
MRRLQVFQFAPSLLRLNDLRTAGFILWGQVCFGTGCSLHLGGLVLLTHRVLSYFQAPELLTMLRTRSSKVLACDRPNWPSWTKPSRT